MKCIIKCRREGISRPLYFVNWNGTNLEFGFQSGQAKRFDSHDLANRQIKGFKGLTEIQIVEIKGGKN
jgi:hypothetical protein